METANIRWRNRKALISTARLPNIASGIAPDATQTSRVKSLQARNVTRLIHWLSLRSR